MGSLPIAVGKMSAFSPEGALEFCVSVWPPEMQDPSAGREVEDDV